MTDDEIRALDQAHKEGKKIQWQPNDWPKDEWADVPTDAHRIKWDVPHVIYRVAPEPE